MNYVSLILSLYVENAVNTSNFLDKLQIKFILSYLLFVNLLTCLFSNLPDACVTWLPVPPCPFSSWLHLCPTSL